MVLSTYLYQYPYKFLWRILSSFGKNLPIVCYCAQPLDYFLFENIQSYLKPVPLCGKRKTRLYLKSIGIACKRMPCFPKAVIMFRHAAHKFPENRILKIGLRHGAYSFKKYTRAENYNKFSIFLTTSKQDVKIAESLGCKTVYSIGYPKLDPLFNGQYNEKTLQFYREKAVLNPKKKTILFTTTYPASGMSAIDMWIDKLDKFTTNYNVLVTVHPRTKKKYKNKLSKQPGIYFIRDINPLPYLAIADLMIADYSSIMGEFCALNKPIITLKIKPGKRAIRDIFELIRKISVQVNSLDELPEAIEHALDNPDELKSAREEAREMMFDSLDGKAGIRAAEQIIRYLPELKLDKY